MTSVYSCPAMMGMPVEVLTAEAIKANLHGEQGGLFMFQRLPADPIGSLALALTNVVVGSRVTVLDQAGTTTFYDQIAASSTVEIQLNVYALGSGLNNLRIKVRKASAAPFYKAYETLMTATPGSNSIYVKQDLD